jgi:hypothetical protein
LIGELKMALCANCSNDLFGGKVCYKCGLRVGGPVGAPQPPASTAPQHQPPPKAQQAAQYQPQYQQPAQYQQSAQYQPMQSSGTNGLAIASFLCSFFIFPLGIVFGHIALSQIKKTNQGGKGLATAGLIISYLALAFILFAY